MTTKHVDEAVLVALIAPWLPDATVDTVEIQTTCGCYSEYTTEPCFFHVTFRAPRPAGESDAQLSKVVSVLDGVVSQWARHAYEWTGCSCCLGEEADTDSAAPSVWVRVIPARGGASHD